MNTRIIVDSTSDLYPELKSRVHVMPLTLRFGEEEYLDGVTIDHKTFYEKLAQSEALPTTSQGTPSAFEAEYEKAKQAGESAVVITLAAKLSGTYQSAVIAAEDYENIYVVESGNVAMGGGVLVELAVRYMDEGLSAKEIAEKLEEAKQKIVILALVDTLEYLKKGGRISKTVAFAGAVLNIKPLISVTDGEIHMVGKARGAKQGTNMLVQEIEKAGGIDRTKPVLLGYSGLSDAAVVKFIEDTKDIWGQGLDPIRHTSLGSVIGTHVGPGAVAIAFFSN
jgi:DegV family protein with EDD domain